MDMTAGSIPHALIRAAVDIRRAGVVLTSEIQRLEALVTALREWCDRTEGTARAEPLCVTGCSCQFEARMQLIDEVRSLLPVNAKT